MAKGIFYILISGLFFLVMNILVKLLTGSTNNLLGSHLQNYPVHELVLARSIISFFISFCIIKYKKLPVFGVNKRWLLSRGISGMIALTLFFYTIRQLPLAIASTLQYLGPIFTILITLLFFKEKVKPVQWLFIILAFSGVIIMSSERIFETTSTSFSISWIFIGILSALFSGMAYSSIVKLRETDEPINIVIYFPMVSIPVMAIWCTYECILPRGIEWVLLLLIGIVTQIAQVAMTKALLYGQTAVIAPFQYLGAIYASICGYLIFSENLSPIVYLGIIIILLGVLLNTVVSSSKKS